MRGLLKTLGALAFLAMLCLYPETAQEAAREAMGLWWSALVPSLAPFLIALPALCTQEACAVYRRLLGRVLPRAGLAPEMAGTVVIGLVSGSPAGAASLNRLCAVCPMERGRLLRCAWLASGASPAFLLTAVARGMLNAPQLAWPLVTAQWGGQLMCLALLRRMEPLQGIAALPARTEEQESVVWQAARSLLVIGGYMLLFSVLSALLSRCVRGGRGVQAALHALLELGGGCAEIAGCSELPLGLRACLISACASLGGLSSCLQAHAYLKPLGIPLSAYLGGKLIQATLSGWLMALQLMLRFPEPALDPFAAGAALALLLLLWVMLQHKARPQPA